MESLKTHSYEMNEYKKKMLEVLLSILPANARENLYSVRCIYFLLNCGRQSKTSQHEIIEENYVHYYGCFVMNLLVVSNSRI